MEDKHRADFNQRLNAMLELTGPGTFDLLEETHEWRELHLDHQHATDIFRMMLVAYASRSGKAALLASTLLYPHYNLTLIAMCSELLTENPGSAKDARDMLEQEAREAGWSERLSVQLLMAIDLYQSAVDLLAPQLERLDRDLLSTRR